MTETETILGTVTKDDVSAIRKANMASFYWSAKFVDWKWEGEGAIRLTRRLPNAGPLDEKERTHEIKCTGKLSDYSERNDMAKTWGTVHCFAMEHTCSQANDWQTFAAIVRPGDVICLEWSKDHYRAGYARDEHGVELHFDSMAIVIKRGEKRLTFNLCTSLCPHNSARMIRSFR